MIIPGSDVRQHLPEFLKHFAALTCDDRYNRFFHTVSPEAIRDWLLGIEERSDEKHIFNVVTGEHDEFVGIVQLAINKERMDGDVSVSVVPEFQKKGIGSQMLQCVIDIAKESGVHTLHFNCEHGNHKCRSLYTKLGFSSRYDPEEQCVCGSLELGD